MDTLSRRTAVAPEADFRRWRQHGDAAALGRVFDLLAPELLLVAAHLAGRGSAEDLVQATFVAAITDASRWQDERPLLPWLVGILANLARRERSRAQRQIDERRLATRSVRQPHEEVEREEAARLLAAALQGMPRHYRHVLTLRLVHGLEPLAIAQSLGAPPATIKSRLQRGLAMLQRALPAGLRSLAVAPFLPVFVSLTTARAAVLAHANSLLAGGSLASGAVLASGGMLLVHKLQWIVAVAVVATAAWWIVPSFAATPANSMSQPVAEHVVPAREVAKVAEPPIAESAPSREVVAVEVPAAASPAAVPRLRGRVVDDGARLLADVEIYLGDKSATMFDSAHRFLIQACFGDHAGEAQRAQAQSTRTAADGTFELALPTNGRPHLLVAYAATRGCRAIDAPTAATDAIEIVLPVDPVTTGVVRAAADHRVIASAEVQCWPDRSGYPIEYRRTGEDGTFRFLPLPAGAYRLSVKAEGFAQLETSYRLGDGGITSPLELDLVALPAIDLWFVDADAQPWTPSRIAREIGGAAPQFQALMSKRPYRRLGERDAETWDSYLLRLGDDGHLRGSCSVADARVFTLWCGGKKLFEVAGVDVRGDRLVAAMLPRTTIALPIGIVRPESVAEEAPREVRLALTDPAGFAAIQPVVVEQRTTAASCVLEVPGQLAGTECGLLAECKGCAPFFTVVAIPERSVGNWQQVTLLPDDQSLRGVVVDEAGKSIPNASLLLAAADGSWYLPPILARRDTALDGSFAFDHLPARPARLIVEADGLAPRAFEVDPSAATPLRLSLRAGREIAVVLPGGVISHCTVVRDGSGRVLQDDRMSGTKRYGQLTVRADLDAATIAVFDGATGELVGEGQIPADGTPLRLAARSR